MAVKEKVNNAFRAFIEAPRWRKARISLLLVATICAWYDPRILAVALIADGIGSVWRYWHQSDEEHLLRLCRAMAGYRLLTLIMGGSLLVVI